MVLQCRYSYVACPRWLPLRSGRCKVLDVEPGRVLRVAETFAAQPWGPPPEVCLCTMASELLDAAGVAVSLGASSELGSGALHTVCATDGARAGETRQFDLGEGPSYPARRTGRPVQVPDLEGDDTWPVFTAAATALGFRAVFAFPLRSGSDTIGALTLYRHVAGELTSEQHADALVVARFALALLSSLQAGHPPDELDQVFTDGMARTEKVSQASGMVSVQLGIPVDAALAVLRAHAFAEACSLAEVATQVIERRLILGPLQD